MFSVLCTILILASFWRMFQKMGREGWEGIVPLYNTYVIFQELYGNGWRFLTLLIPLYNIWVSFKMNIDLARAFHRTTGFGIGLTLVSFVFYPILAFGHDTYENRSPVVADDVVSRTLDDVADRVTSAGSVYRDQKTAELLKQYKDLLDAGVLTQEEFQAKKDELLHH